jgi:hypothetical protein
MLSYGAGLRAPNNTRGRNDFVTGVLGSGVGRIDGVVQVPGTPNQPVKRRVRLYRQEDGYLVREAWSDSSTGAFSFDYVDEKQLYYICAFDHTNAFVGLIADNLTPSLLETSTVDAYAGALKRLITITGAGGAGTGYAMLFKIGESSGSAGSDFNLEAVTTTFPLDKNIPGDVQFTDVSGSPLPQWVEQVTGTAPNRVAWFWVKVSADLSTTQSIYCTYRNGMSTASNGNTVFLLFDDFDDGTLDTGKWSNVTGSGSYVISGSEFVLTGTGVGRALYSATTFGDGMEVVGKVGPSATSLSYNGKFGFETQYIFQNDWDSQGSSEVVVGPSTKTQLDARYQTTYYRMRIRRAGGAGSMLVNDVVKHTQGSGIGTSSVPVWLMNVYDATVAGKVDWIAVKKYMLTEPTYYSADTSIPAATTVINMTFDTGNGSTTFTDTGSQASSWQIGTGAVQCSTTAVLEGVSSLFVPGGGFAYLYTTAYSANMLPATSDFSLKFKARSSSWLRFDASGCYLISIQGAVGNGADTQFAIATNLNTYLAFAYSDGTTRSAVTGTTPVPVNVTVSFEFKRVGSTLSLLMNGVLQCSATLSGALNVPSGQQWRIGAPAGAQGGAFNGMYFDSLSLTVG